MQIARGKSWFGLVWFGFFIHHPVQLQFTTSVSYLRMALDNGTALKHGPYPCTHVKPVFARDWQTNLIIPFQQARQKQLDSWQLGAKKGGKSPEKIKIRPEKQ